MVIRGGVLTAPQRQAEKTTNESVSTVIILIRLNMVGLTIASLPKVFSYRPHPAYLPSLAGEERRAQRAAGVSLDPSRYTIVTVLDRIASMADPMAGLLEHRPNLAQALTRLGRWVGG